jgi:ribonuclease HI
VAAEAMAVLLAIQLCRELGFLRVHLEGDAKGVIDAINYVDVDKCWMGHVIEDIKVELKTLAHWKLTLTLVKREGNQVAHNLAKYAVMNCINDS